MRVRLVDLDDHDPTLAEKPHKPGGIGASRLDPHTRDQPEALEPGQKLAVSLHPGREGSVTEQPATLVERSGVVGIAMRIDATGDFGHPVLAVVSMTRAAPAGTGGQNSDEARVASRFL